MPSLRFVLTLLQATAPGGEAAGAMWADGLGSASPFGWAPLILLGGPALVAVVLLWLYARTARQHRRALMAPPVWLLPYLEQPAEAVAGWSPPAPDADHAELEEIRLDSTARLARRKRILLVGLGLNFVAGWAGAAVYLYTGNRPVEFQELSPGAVLGASVDTAAFLGIEGPGVVEAEPVPVPPPDAAVDTAQQRARREQQALFIRRRDSLAEARRLDSLAVVEAVAQRVRDSVAQALRDSIARVQAAAVPAPVPPPPPPPVATPARDPAVERARATEVIRTRVGALAAAINGRAGLSGLLAAGPERERFLRFIQEQAPTASVDHVPEPELSADHAEAVVTLQLQWRAQFGVSRREVVRFQVEASLLNGAWQVARLVPLNTPQ